MKLSGLFFLLLCCILPPGALRAGAAGSPATMATPSRAAASSNPLSPAHAGSKQSGVCAQCHAGSSRPSNAGCHASSQDFQKFHLFDQIERCTQCHIGYHAPGFQQDCAVCHGPDRWRPALLAKFNHQTQTRFPLAGRHTALACEDCHKNNHFEGAPAACGACHQNPHEGRFAQRCAECHTPVEFVGAALKFDHNSQTRFPLAGLHAARDCALCHADLGFRVRGVTCATCHADVAEFYAGTLLPSIAAGQPDPMHGKAKCQDCHKPDDKKADYDAIRARYAAIQDAKDGAAFDAVRRTLAERIKRLLPTLAQDPAKKSALETIRRLGLHNPAYAGKLLDALEAPAKGGY